MSTSFLKGKKIFISGAAGSIGSALANKVAQQKPKELIIFDQDETALFDLYESLKEICKVRYFIGSVREIGVVESALRATSPQIVYHAAAYKHVVLMEEFPLEAIKTNVMGTNNLFEAAQRFGVEKFVFISSDKAVNPTSVMGKTKLFGEQLCRNYKGKMKCIVVRFGNVMPSRGSVVPIFNKLIKEGKNLPVTSPKMKRYFLGIYDAVKLVLKATEYGKGGETFVLDMGEPLVISELAKIMIKLSGKDLGITYTKPSKGEKFDEELFTKEERSRAVKKDGLYIVYGK